MLFPSNWIIAKIVDISDVIFGQSPPSTSYNYKGEGLPFFQGKSDFKELYPIIRMWCFAPKKIALKNDILISVRAPVGPTNLSPDKSCIGRGLAAIRPISGIIHKYIFYFFRSVEKQIEKKGTGTTFKAITKNDLINFNITLCSLNEQKEIVGRIESLFEKLDAGEESLKKIKGQLKTYRQAVLKAAFAGELTKEWREKRQREEPEKFRQEQKELEKYKIDDPDLPILPEGWLWTSVGKISDRIHYGYTEKSNINQVGPKFLRITDIQDNKVNWDKVPFCKIDRQEMEKYLLKPGDIVFARTGATVGKSFLLNKNIPKAVFASYLIRIIIKNEINREFIYNFFKSTNYWLQIGKGKLGIGQPNVNANILSKIIVPFTTYSEQNEIVREIEKRFALADKVEKAVDECLEKARQLRQSILREAFNGNLTEKWRQEHPELITGENSAQALLEKIKAEREKSKTKKEKEKTVIVMKKQKRFKSKF